MPKSAFALLALLGLLTAFLTMPAFSADDKLDPELAELAKKLKSKSSPEQIKALQDIGGKAEAARPIARNVCEAVLNTNAKVSQTAVAALGKVRPDLHQLLLQMADPDLNKHLQAIQEFGKMGKDAAPAIVLVIADMKKVAVDPKLSPKVKGMLFELSMDALINMGPDDANVVNTLVTLGGPKNREVELRTSALRNLANLTDNNPALTKQFVPMVAAAVNDPQLRVVGLELVGKLPSESARAMLPTLNKLKNDKDATVSKAAGEALDRIDAIGSSARTMPADPKVTATAKTPPGEPKSTEAGKTMPGDAKAKELIVNNAIAWIVRNQQPNGSWRTSMGDNRPALVVTTSWCALSLLATGNPKFRPLVAKASAYVIDNMFENKGIVKLPPEWDQTNWSIAIGGLFLCEYYAAMKTDPDFKSPELEKNIEKAVSEAFRRMEDSGGWGHTPRLKNALGYVELEIMSNWMLAMLGTAQRLGFQLDQNKVNQAITFVQNCCAEGKGGVGYSPRPGQKGAPCPNRTGGAVFAFALLGKQQHSLYPRMISAWKGLQKDVGEGHGSVAMGFLGSALGARQMGEAEWKTFTTAMYPAFEKAINPDGSFNFLKGTTIKSTGADNTIGPAYNTGIYTLISLLDNGQLKFLGKKQS